MQMPMLSYPNFCQFLQLHQHHTEQNGPVQQRRCISGVQAADLSENSADTSLSNSPSHSPSNSPPLPARLSDKLQPGKSFTIDAILGLNDDRQREPITFHSAFHNRLAMSLPGVNSQPASAYANPALKDKYGSEGNKKCSGKSKRVRTIFTPEQLERLEGEFERQQYMVGPERLYLAHTLQLTEAQVKVWFQNRRIKWRKQHLEIQQQRLAVLKDNHRDDDISVDSEDSSTAPRFTTFAHDRDAAPCTPPTAASDLLHSNDVSKEFSALLERH